MASTRLRDIAALDAFLPDLPVLFGSLICAWSSADGASCLEAVILPRCGVQF
jgi:hypothetical protein